MKKKIHPTYNQSTTITCACGNVLTVGSTAKDMQTEICSACHPFYTGKQKVIDSAGRVDRFRRQQDKQQAMVKAKPKKKTAKKPTTKKTVKKVIK